MIVCAPSRAEVGRAYIALGLGMLLIFLSDFFYVKDLSSGDLIPSTLPRRLGVDFAQGFHLGGPEPTERAERFALRKPSRSL